jgi:hypothetical protein
MQADLNTNINIKKNKDRVRSDRECNMKKNHSLILQRTRTQMYKYILVIKCYNYANKSLKREIFLFFFLCSCLDNLQRITESSEL